MKIIVCSCLLGNNCKYNGKNNRNEELLAYLQGKEIRPVCPEAMGGLPTPREPVEWVKGRALYVSGGDVTAEFDRGAALAAEFVAKEQPDRVIMQPRSPSCGVGFIYDGTFSGHLIPGHGDFATQVLALGYQVAEQQLSDKFIILEKMRG